jgi:hypothetical protein
LSGTGRAPRSRKAGILSGIIQTSDDPTASPQGHDNQRNYENANHMARVSLCGSGCPTQKGTDYITQRDEQTVGVRIFSSAERRMTGMLLRGVTRGNLDVCSSRATGHLLASIRRWPSVISKSGFLRRKLGRLVRPLRPNPIWRHRWPCSADCQDPCWATAGSLQRSVSKHVDERRQYTNANSSAGVGGMD